MEPAARRTTRGSARHHNGFVYRDRYSEQRVPADYSNMGSAAGRIQHSRSDIVDRGDRAGWQSISEPNARDDTERDYRYLHARSSPDQRLDYASGRGRQPERAGRRKRARRYTDGAERDRHA